MLSIIIHREVHKQLYIGRALQNNITLQKQITNTTYKYNFTNFTKNGFTKAQNLLL